MKKALLSTSAIVGVGLLAAPASAAEKIKLSVGGYMEQYVGFVDAEDDTGTRDMASFDNMSDSEVYFKGKTTLDNGITFAVTIELEGDEDSGGTIDESYLQVQSPTLGELRLGGDDAVDGIMNVQASRGISGDYDNWIPEANMAKNDNLYDNASSDNNKVSYFSPNFAGFQVGVSYTSAADNNAVDTPNHQTGAGPLWAAAVVYKGSFSDVGVTVGANTSHLSHGANHSAGHKNYAAGAQLSYMNFGIGGGYARTLENPIAGGTSTGNDGSRYQVGVTYNYGNGTVGAWYMNAQSQGQGNIPGDDEAEVFTVHGNYTLSDGIKLEGMVFNVDYSNEENTDAVEQEGGWGVVAGFRLDF